MAIRNAKVEDKFRITELAENCSPLLRASIDGTYEFLARCFENTFFVYEVNGELIGYIVGFPNTAKKGEFWLYQVCVCGKHREKRIGSELLEELINQVKSEGYGRIRSHLQFVNEHSLNLHRKFGFEIYGQDDRGWFLELIFSYQKKQE